MGMDFLDYCDCRSTFCLFEEQGVAVEFGERHKVFDWSLSASLGLDCGTFAMVYSKYILFLINPRFFDENGIIL